LLAGFFEEARMAMQDAVEEGPEPPETAPAAWNRRAAAEAWSRRAELLEELSKRASTSREARMDAQRRLEALRRTQAALLARTEETVAEALASLEEVPRAVLVHRSAWMREKLSLHLSELGVQVRAEADDGAEGLGIAIAEQPDVVVIEDRLPSLLAVELVAGVREYVPQAIVAAQVEHDEDVPRLVEAGVAAVFSRRIPPGLIAEELAGLLAQPRDEPLLLH
jgi:CheY-like chemotaxis protein